MMRSVAFLLVLALFTSCAPKLSELMLSTADTPPDVLLRRVGEQGGRVSTLIGSGIMTFDSPEMAGSAAFESNMRKPDSLLVNLSGPFGIDVGTLFLTRDSFVMYNSLENSVMTGNPSGRAIRSVIPFDLTYDQILNLFVGIFAVPPPDASVTEYKIDDGRFVVTEQCGEFTCIYWIDPKYLLVSRYEMRNSLNEIVVEGRASSFTEQDGVVAARRVAIKFPQQSRQVSIAYNQVRLNSGTPRFRYSIPSNARRILQ